MSIRKIMRRPWRAGAALGLLVALLTGLLASTGLHESLGIADAVGYLAAAPIFIFDVVFSANQAIQWLVLFTWWGAVGAALGWLVGQGRAGWAVAVLFALTVMTAHAAARNDIGHTLEGALRAVEQSVRDSLR